MSLMFDKHDVEEARAPLVRLLRLIFYRYKITMDDYSTLWANHGRVMGYSHSDTNTNRNNARRALASPTKMTWRVFHHNVLNILRLDIEEFHTVLRNHKTGERIVIGSNDPVDPVEATPPLTIALRNPKTGKRDVVKDNDPVDPPELLPLEQD